MTTVYFFHGSISSPKSSKIQRLKPLAESQGFQVDIPDHSNIRSADERVADFLSQDNLAIGDCILYGSSMGGYVATILSEHLKPSGLFLLAPAFYIPGYAVQNPIPHADKTSIIHGWHDDVVPLENSIRFARQHNSTLHIIDGQHHLRENSDTIASLWRLFLKYALEE